MKILFVLEHFYPYIGGAEKLFHILTTNLAKEGHEVTVITTLYKKDLPKQETVHGVNIIRVNCYNRFGFTILSIPQIFKHAKGSDIIHTTTYNAALPSIIVGSILRKKVIVTFHEVWGLLWKKLPFASFLEKNAFYNFEKLLLHLPFSKFIAVSEFTKTELIAHGIDENKITRIYNGIEYDLFKNYELSPPKKFTFTYFGRLGISKGLDILIPAAAKFAKAYPDSIFKLIIPKQPEGMYREIMKLIKKYNLESYIVMHHNLPRQQLYDELLSSSTVVIPSYSEGFCFAAAETIALGIPMISSQQGALKEVVCGSYLSFENQDAHQLFLALEKAYHGQWDHKPTVNYHLKDTIKEYIQVYSDLAKQN